MAENPHTEKSRFRPVYRELTAEEVAVLRDIKVEASVMETLFENVPNGREKSLALTKLEESVMWAVKGLTG